MTATGEARVHQRGYRRYEGDRRGVSSAMVSVARYTAQRALGLHRPARTKVFPILVVALAYIPALVYVGVTVLGNRLQQRGVPGRVMADQFIPSYAANYRGIVLAVVVFAAFVAPEVLCSDRRTSMLSLYLASPLDRRTYLLAKGAAVSAILALVTLGPPLVLLIGYGTQGFGPSGVVDWLSTIGRIVAAGVVVSALSTVLSMAVASLTTRSGVASAAVLVVLLGSFGVVNFLVQGAQASRWLRLADLFDLPYEAVYRIFAEPSPFVFGGQEELPAWTIYAANAGWVLVGLGVISIAYRRVTVR